MNCCCENCGWSEVIGSPIMCNYSGNRTWRDECCKAWKPKTTEENDMVKVVRCNDCWKREFDNCPFNEFCGFKPDNNWFCADGETRE